MNVNSGFEQNYDPNYSVPRRRRLVQPAQYIRSSSMPRQRRNWYLYDDQQDPGHYIYDEPRRYQRRVQRNDTLERLFYHENPVIARARREYIRATHTRPWQFPRSASMPMSHRNFVEQEEVVMTIPREYAMEGHQYDDLYDEENVLMFPELQQYQQGPGISRIRSNFINDKNDLLPASAQYQSMPRQVAPPMHRPPQRSLEYEDGMESVYYQRSNSLPYEEMVGEEDYVMPGQVYETLPRHYEDYDESVTRVREPEPKWTNVPGLGQMYQNIHRQPFARFTPINAQYEHQYESMPGGKEPGYFEAHGRIENIPRQQFARVTPINGEYESMPRGRGPGHYEAHGQTGVVPRQYQRSHSMPGRSSNGYSGNYTDVKIPPDLGRQQRQSSLPQALLLNNHVPLDMELRQKSADAANLEQRIVMLEWEVQHRNAAANSEVVEIPEPDLAWLEKISKLTENIRDINNSEKHPLKYPKYQPPSDSSASTVSRYPPRKPFRHQKAKTKQTSRATSQTSPLRPQKSRPAAKKYAGKTSSGDKCKIRKIIIKEESSSSLDVGMSKLKYKNLAPSSSYKPMEKDKHTSRIPDIDKTGAYDSASLDFSLIQELTEAKKYSTNTSNEFVKYVRSVSGGTTPSFPDFLAFIPSGSEQVQTNELAQKLNELALTFETMKKT